MSNTNLDPNFRSVPSVDVKDGNEETDEGKTKEEIEIRNENRSKKFEKKLKKIMVDETLEKERDKLDSLESKHKKSKKNINDIMFMVEEAENIEDNSKQEIKLILIKSIKKNDKKFDKKFKEIEDEGEKKEDKIYKEIKVITSFITWKRIYQVSFYGKIEYIDSDGYIIDDKGESKSIRKERLVIID